MKRIFLLLIVCMLSQLGEAQTFDKLYKELKDAPNATKVEMNRTAMFFVNMLENTMGVKRLKVLSVDDCTPEQLTQIKAAIKKGDEPRFSLFASVNDEGVRSRVYLHIEGESIKEMLVLSLDESFAYVYMEGDISMNDVEGIAAEYEKK